MTSTSPLLAAIEVELDRQAAALSGPMLEVCRSALAGGRRTRALLLLRAAEQATPRALLAAAALEMLHAATLLQDDIIDAGDLRRGRPAAYLRFGKPLTILTSDWLLLRALELAADVDLEFFHSLARAGVAMTQAEAQGFAPLPLHSLQEAQSHGIAIAQGKTASLFGAALCGAAVLRGLSVEDRGRWKKVGVEIGLTYQIVDDCVDLYEVEEVAGKTLGHDLVTGCLTLPLMYALSALEKRGIPISLLDLKSGCLATRDLLRLHTEARSTEVMIQMSELLHQRFAAHRQEALETGISASAIDPWLADLLIRAGSCLQGRLVPADETTSFPPATTDFAANWQSHA